MLESVNPDLVVHQGSPTKHPEVRLETIRAAGELRIPFTTGILVGIGESADERIEALEALAELHREYGHIQEIILQNFVPHPRYYGREVAEIADRLPGAAGRQRVCAHRPPHPRRRADGVDGVTASELPGLGRREITLDDMKLLVARVPAADARGRDPDPAQPRRLVGRPGRVRGDRPRRAVGQRRPHLARARVPEPASGPQAPGPARLRADRAPLRLSAVPRARVARPGRPRRRQGALLELHPAPGVGAAFGAPGRSRAGAAGDRARTGRRAALGGRADRALLRDQAGGDRGDARGGRRAARRARGRHRHLRRQPQRQLHQRLRGRLRVLRLRPGQALARRLPRRRGRLPGPDRRGGRVRGDRDLHAGGDPPRLHPRALRRVAAPGQAGGAAASPARVLADGGPLHVRALGPLARGRLRLPRRVRARLDPGHRRRGARRRRADPDLARTSCPPRAGSRSSRPAIARVCARPRP